MLLCTVVHGAQTYQLLSLCLKTGLAAELYAAHPDSPEDSFLSISVADTRECTAAITLQITQHEVCYVLDFAFVCVLQYPQDISKPLLSENGAQTDVAFRVDAV